MRLRWCAAINNCFALRPNKWGVCHHGEKVGTRVSSEIHNNHLGKFQEKKRFSFLQNCQNLPLTCELLPRKESPYSKIPDDSAMKPFKEKNDIQISFNLNKDKSLAGEG